MLKQNPDMFFFWRKIFQIVVVLELQTNKKKIKLKNGLFPEFTDKLVVIALDLEYES